ncbi:MAG: MetS family NSS transporter small subunit [Acidobacteria bacterium]|nr:MetS family NSS transporter small subunit [Acidobacteriota bacterium]
MSATALLFMFLVCGVVWGGFAGLLLRAIRREGRKP